MTLVRPATAPAGTPPSNHLPEGSQVRRHSKRRLSAAPGVTEASHHLVEHQALDSDREIAAIMFEPGGLSDDTVPSELEFLQGLPPTWT